MIMDLGVNKDYIKFRYEVLFIFTLFEVLLYDGDIGAQLIVSIIEYLFILFTFGLNRRIGIMYFLSFTLLSMGAWSYVIQETLPYNFWGLRVFGYSVNIIFSIILLFLSLLSDNFKYKLAFDDLASKFLTVFILYSLFQGIVWLMFSVNYFDNFLKDSLLYLPYFVYMYLLGWLNITQLLKIVRYCISLTVISMLLSLFFNQLFQYGEGFYFVLMNSFAFVVIFSIFFLRDLYSGLHYYLLLISTFFLLITGSVFIGSKMVIILFILIFWIIIFFAKARRLFFFTILLLFFFVGPLIAWVSNNISSDLVISYKFLQIYEVFSLINLDSIASSNTSMGNVVAEGVTIFKYLKENPIALIFGKGFGGATPDIYGYLAPMVGDGAGYAQVDLNRNAYVRMHLPIYEVIIKSGIFGVSVYLTLLVKSFKSKNIFSLIFFVLLFTVFSNTKEMLLLSLVFMRLSTYLSSSMMVSEKFVNNYNTKG